ncbi:VOC family protein [Streptomyces sp. MZ04]|uniref:VOC family protein n=1 Tax=Streptomyces sp. MZ04 TaxID=2559236 RepID=UPI00107EBCE9|nr:VOC family protein [Streptomyces sp. MZ04]TGA95758.1 VOC family protein [Streptomyces sp. MZ04]
MTATSTPSTLRTGHIGLNVTDIERSLAFYRDVIGYGVIGEGKEEGRRFAFLGEGTRPVLTLWQQADAAYAATNAGLHHLAIEVDTIEQVRAYESALRAYGVEFAYDGVVPHGEGAASGGIFFHDPDGTRLEIYSPTGADTATAPVEAAPTCGFF